MKRADIIVRARSLIGVPWRHQGRNWTQGIDCVGLPVLVGESLGLWNREDMPSNYPRRPSGDFVDLFKMYGIIRNPLEHEDGDVLIFSQRGHACHCGIRSTFRSMPGVIHAHASYRKVVEQTLESSISMIGKPGFVFSFPELED